MFRDDFDKYGGGEDDDEDPRKVLREEYEFTKAHFFEYLIVFGISLIATACLIAAFLFIMSSIYNG